MVAHRSLHAIEQRPKPKEPPDDQKFKPHQLEQDKAEHHQLQRSKL